MEGAGGDVITESEPVKTASQFSGCLPGERERERVAGIGVAGGYAVSDPSRQHPGLSRPCTGDHCHQLRLGHDGDALIGIQISDQGIGIHGPSVGGPPLRPGANYPEHMAYPRKLLNPHEEVAVDLHPHWWHYAQPVAVLVASIALGIVTLVVTEGGTRARNIMGWIALICLVLSILWLIGRYMKWATTNFVITSDRLIFREGVVAKRGVEIPLERVNTVHFSQSVFERMVGAGDLVIESGGEDGQQRFTDIRKPDRVQREIHTQMEENEKRRFTMPTSSGTDVASQLEKLEGMLERGTLSTEEFQAQKGKLLGS